MNWLVDAQLPMHLTRLLRERGEDAIHTRDLPDGNRSTDTELLAVAERDDRIIVTKDADFAISFRLQGQPRRLLLIATGNIANPALESLFLAALPELLVAFIDRNYIELHATRDTAAALLVIHP